VAGALILAVAAALGWGTYQRNEVYQSALAIWNDIAEKCPLNYRAYNNRGKAYRSKGQYDAAIKDYDKAIELKSDCAEAYYNRGNALNSEGQYDAAIRDYDKAIELKPDFALAYNNRAVTHYQMKAYDKAWADVKMYRKLGGTPHPKFIEALTRVSGRSE
jgi:tetratricopeptide (TPR) repeat protein